jgi:hypothetical protein
VESLTDFVSVFHTKKSKEGTKRTKRKNGIL